MRLLFREDGEIKKLKTMLAIILILRFASCLVVLGRCKLYFCKTGSAKLYLK